MNINFMNAQQFKSLSLHTIGRSSELFTVRDFDDITLQKFDFSSKSFLVIGAAGFVGSKLTQDLILLGASDITLLDQDENNLVNLTRELRRNFTENKFKLTVVTGDFNDALVKNQFITKSYDVIIFVAAYKHVRTERNLLSALNLIYNNAIKWNLLMSDLTASKNGQIFVLSTDKANYPANYMGLSKLLMEHVTWHNSHKLNFHPSSARFANVAFSSGSLLQSWLLNFSNNLPLAMPSNTKRYFLTHSESSALCLYALLENNDNSIITPKTNDKFRSQEFEILAERFLDFFNLKPYFINIDEYKPNSIDISKFINGNSYPIILTKLDTSGEKSEEILVSDMNTIKTEHEKYLVLGPEKIDSSFLDIFINKFENTSRILESFPAFESLEEEIRNIFPFFAPNTNSVNLDSRI